MIRSDEQNIKDNLNKIQFVIDYPHKTSDEHKNMQVITILYMDKDAEKNDQGIHPILPIYSLSTMDYITSPIKDNANMGEFKNLFVNLLEIEKLDPNFTIGMVDRTLKLSDNTKPEILLKEIVDNAQLPDNLLDELQKAIDSFKPSTAGPATAAAAVAEEKEEEEKEKEKESSVMASKVRSGEFGAATTTSESSQQKKDVKQGGINPRSGRSKKAHHTKKQNKTKRRANRAGKSKRG